MKAKLEKDVEVASKLDITAASRVSYVFNKISYFIFSD